MANQVRNYGFGGGLVIVEGQEVGKVTSASIALAWNELIAKSGDELDPWAVEIVGRDITGNVEFSVYSKEAVAQIIGGTQSDSEGYHWEADETLTVAAGSATNAQTAYLSNSTKIKSIDGTKAFTFITSGTPAVGEFKENVPSSGTYTFSSGEASTVKASYAYTTASADKLTLSTNTEPGYVTLVLTNQARNMESGSKSFHVYYFPKVRFNSFDIATQTEDYTTYSASFRALADSNGDVLHISGEDS